MTNIKMVSLIETGGDRKKPADSQKMNAVLRLNLIGCAFTNIEVVGKRKTVQDFMEI